MDFLYKKYSAGWKSSKIPYLVCRENETPGIRDTTPQDVVCRLM